MATTATSKPTTGPPAAEVWFVIYGAFVERCVQRRLAALTNDVKRDVTKLIFGALSDRAEVAS
jgi:hypothetical protein